MTTRPSHPKPISHDETTGELLPENAQRRGFVVDNNTNMDIHLMLGNKAASATRFWVIVRSKSRYATPEHVRLTDRVTYALVQPPSGYSYSASPQGGANVTEYLEAP